MTRGDDPGSGTTAVEQASASSGTGPEPAGPGEGSRRRLVVGLVAAGIALVLAAGLVAWLLTRQDGSARGPGTREAVEAPLITDPSAPTLPLAETPQDFVAAFGDAASRGAVDWLLSRLHPAVLARYGEEACARYVSELVVQPGVRLRAASVAGPGTWVWESDGRSTDVDEVYRIDAHRFSGGSETTGDIEVANVDGLFRYFADCGDVRR